MSASFLIPSSCQLFCGHASRLIKRYLQSALWLLTHLPWTQTSPSWGSPGTLWCILTTLSDSFAQLLLCYICFMQGLSLSFLVSLRTSAHCSPSSDYRFRNQVPLITTLVFSSQPMKSWRVFQRSQTITNTTGPCSTGKWPFFIHVSFKNNCANHGISKFHSRLLILISLEK